ncbi:hypothetical protein ES708_32152 [subsurface metagenome]
MSEQTGEMERMHILRIEIGKIKKATIRDNNTITSLNREINTKDELVTSLKTDIETLEKANLLLENNLRILHLSMEK